MEDKIKELIGKYELGLNHHKNQMNSKSVSTIEKNRASYLRWQCEAIIGDLKGLLNLTEVKEND